MPGVRGKKKGPDQAHVGINGVYSSFFARRGKTALVCKDMDMSCVATVYDGNDLGAIRRE